MSSVPQPEQYREAFDLARNVNRRQICKPICLFGVPKLNKISPEPDSTLPIVPSQAFVNFIAKNRILFWIKVKNVILVVFMTADIAFFCYLNMVLFVPKQWRLPPIRYP